MSSKIRMRCLLYALSTVCAVLSTGNILVISSYAFVLVSTKKCIKQAGSIAWFSCVKTQMSARLS